MKKTIIVVFALWVYGLAIGSADSGDGNQVYETYLNKKIICCLNKSRMLLNTRSEKLQYYAAKNLQKASCFIKAKESIIADLNKSRGILKPHQIDVYLNTRFTRISKANLLAVK